MDENTSLRNLHYGFQNREKTVYSNLPLSHLGDWLTRLEETNQKDHFLEPDKSLVIVNINHHYLEHIISQLLPDFLRQAVHQQLQIEMQAHHTAPSFLDVYHSSNGSPVRMVYGRVKGRDSLTEKLTREYVEKGTMASPRPELSFHTLAEDIYGFTIVAKEEKTLSCLDQRLKNDPHLQLIENKDLFLNPKSSGYRALHNFFIWKSNTLPYGTVIEVHLETEEDHPKNRHGDPQHPERSHRNYSKGKLTKPHAQGQHQIILLEKNGFNHEELVPVRLSNKYVDYILINY